MRKRTIAIGFALIAGVQAAAADLIVYPSKGQSPEQQDKDKYECYNWAKKQTGFDPQSASTQSTPQQSTQGGPNAARGAAGGAAVGAITGKPAAGAALGAGVGGIRKRRQEKEAQSQQQAGVAATQQKQQGFEKAQGTCLKGRGYSVD